MRSPTPSAGSPRTSRSVRHHTYSGLVAATWDLLRGDTSHWPDRAFYRDIIRRRGQPALDVGCGTGRLLLNYLAEGIDGKEEVIDGQQRLSAFFRFLDNDYSLKGLKALPHLKPPCLPVFGPSALRQATSKPPWRTRLKISGKSTPIRGGFSMTLARLQTLGNDVGKS